MQEHKPAQSPARRLWFAKKMKRGNSGEFQRLYALIACFDFGEHAAICIVDPRTRAHVPKSVALHDETLQFILHQSSTRLAKDEAHWRGRGVIALYHLPHCGREDAFAGDDARVD